MRTIREQLDRSRGTCFAVALCSLLVFITGLAATAVFPGAMAITIVGFVAFAASVSYLMYWISCPRCRGRIGHSLTWPPGGLMRISSRLKHCVFRGVDFDTQVERTSSGQRPEPPTPVRSAGLGQDETEAEQTTSVVRMYSTRQAAEFGKMVLEGSGIASFIRADDAGGMRPYMTTVTGVRLVVRTEDLERADEILKESEAGCPDADSAGQ